MMMLNKVLCFILIFASIAYLASGFTSITLFQCERSKACFKSSKKCTVDECDFVVSWKSKKYKDKEYLEVELIGKVESTGGYVALGFSEDKHMGNDGLVACIATPGNPKIDIVAAFYDKLMKQTVVFPESEIDKDLLVTSNDDGDYGGRFTAEVNKISCRFLRLLTPTTNADKLKDLSSGKLYHVLVFTGQAQSASQLGPYTPGTNVFSEETVDFSTSVYSTLAGSSKVNSSLAKAHAILMLIAWICCCGIAVILARYYKDTWRRTTPDNEGGWFNAHQGLQSIAFLLIIISLIIIFVHVGSYSKLETIPAKVHPIIGLISCCLFVINPFIALCRCKRLRKDRPWFNWIHFIVGIIAFILSIPTIMIGLRLPGAGVKLSQLDYPLWIVFIFVIIQFIIEITLEIHGCLIYKRNKNKKLDYDLRWNEYEQAIHKNMKMDKPIYPRESGRTFRLCLLAFYIFVCIAVTVILSIIIIIN